jgi:hypothetical protein
MQAPVDYNMLMQMLQMGPQPVADRGPTGPRGINAIAAPESGGVRPYAGGANPRGINWNTFNKHLANPTKEITPQVQARFQRRLENTENIEQVVKDAAKYGVDWSYMLNPMPTYKHD